MEENFYFSDTELTGSIPTQIGLCRSLTIDVDLSNAFLSGPLPTELGSLTAFDSELQLYVNGTAAVVAAITAVSAHCHGSSRYTRRR